MIQVMPPSKSWDKTLTKQLQAQGSQLREAHNDTKKLVYQVKDIQTEMEELRANFMGASNQMQSFKTHLNFRLKLA